MLINICESLILLIVKSLVCRGRIRTCVNVWGDCVGVGVIEKLSHKELVSSAESSETDDEDSAAENIEMLEKEDKRDNTSDC